MVTKKSPKIKEINFICDICDYKCCKNSEYIKHLLTAKHIGNASGNTKISTRTFECKNCDKVYKSRKGLWSHTKHCAENVQDLQQNIIIHQTSPEEVKNLTKLVMELMKSNAELQTQLIDVCRSQNINVNTNINSNNKTFNLHFFLNEKCKDAMNISDFANSFDLKLSDLESVGELGYVEGISKIIVDKLSEMDVYKRPMHCSDAKREIIYIKDDNIWTKEDKNNPKLRQVIKNISFRNMKLVYNWSNTYPESKDNESRLNDKYIKLVLESSGGNGQILDSENKIIRRIAKKIFIEKE